MYTRYKFVIKSIQGNTVYIGKTEYNTVSDAQERGKYLLDIFVSIGANSRTDSVDVIPVNVGLNVF